VTVRRELHTPVRIAQLSQALDRPALDDRGERGPHPAGSNDENLHRRQCDASD